MKCIHCKRKMQRSSAPFHIDRKNYHLLLDSVPAWICTQCGEVYFEETEVNGFLSHWMDVVAFLRQGSAT